MSFEKLPKEDGEEKVIYRIDENTDKTLIEVSASDELICAVENFRDWINAFREHYEQITGAKSEIRRYNAPQVQGVNIPGDSGRIVFEVDGGHSCLRFRIRSGDKEAYDIVNKFIDRIRKI